VLCCRDPRFRIRRLGGTLTPLVQSFCTCSGKVFQKVCLPVRAKLFFFREWYGCWSAKTLDSEFDGWVASSLLWSKLYLPRERFLRSRLVCPGKAPSMVWYGCWTASFPNSTAGWRPQSFGPKFLYLPRRRSLRSRFCLDQKMLLLSSRPLSPLKPCSVLFS
jgi:hypothetical protein